MGNERDVHRAEKKHQQHDRSHAAGRAAAGRAAAGRATTGAPAPVRVVSNPADRSAKTDNARRMAASMGKRDKVRNRR
jgi:hypothetical protein